MQLVVVSAVLKVVRMLSRNKGARVDAIDPTSHATFDLDVAAAQFAFADESNAAKPAALADGNMAACRKRSV